MRNLKHWRYLLSFVVPVHFNTMVVRTIEGDDIKRGGCGNHFLGETHSDAMHIRWWQWRGRCFRERTVTICLPV